MEERGLLDTRPEGSSVVGIGEAGRLAVEAAVSFLCRVDWQPGPVA